MNKPTVALAIIAVLAFIVAIVNNACTHPLIALASVAVYVTAGLLFVGLVFGVRILELFDEG